MSGQPFDEAFEAAGLPRPHYAPLIGALERTDLGALREATERRLETARVCFGEPGELLSLDPVPRLLLAAEWETISAGIVQRARALERFLADVYSEQRIVAAGLVPARVIESSEHYEPAMRGAPVRRWISIVGFDLVRDPGGGFRVLEDQIRMPSGLAYAVAAREAMQGLLPLAAPEGGDRGAFAALGRALRAAAAPGVAEPRVVVLSEGSEAAGWYEHERIARELGVAAVTPADIERHGLGVHARIDGKLQPVDVVYQRTDEDRFTKRGGRPTAAGATLLEPCHAGALACVNAPGAGVADDKLVHSYVETMIRHYLGEEPLLSSVESFDLSEPAQREAALADLERLVVKPRAEMGGEGVVILSQAGAGETAEAHRALERSPGKLIAQECVQLSHHPTLCDGRLEPRHVDLRPYVICAPEGEWAFPGGLTRVALERGSLIVNSGRGGGVKDTWVLAEPLHRAGRSG